MSSSKSRSSEMDRNQLTIVKLHENKQFLVQACDLLNEYWPRSLTAR